MSLTGPELRSLRVFLPGMGVNISSPELAIAVGQASDRLGLPTMVTISGTAAPLVVVSRLQAGDPGGHMRRLLQEKPIQEMGVRIIKRYYHDPANGEARFIYPPKPGVLIGDREARKKELKELLVCSTFALVRRAKEGHRRPVAVNLLTKVELTHAPEIYGAQAGGADVIIMGAGVPTQIKRMMEKFVTHEAVTYQVPIVNSKEKYPIHFDPRRETPLDLNSSLNLPTFILVSGHVALAKRMFSQGQADGVVMENYTAGGHNAPPRVDNGLNERGEPIYSEADDPDFTTLNKTGMPYWLAGGYAENLQGALDIGAQGIQAGSIFALSKESGMNPALRRLIIQHALAGNLEVINNPRASPTGYPIEIVQLPDTLSDSDVLKRRIRMCSLGYLVEVFGARNGSISTRCPAEPFRAYQDHGGRLEDAIDRICLCNALLGTAGYGIMTKNGREPSVVTLGKNLDFIDRLIGSPDGEYTAEDALRFIFKL